MAFSAEELFVLRVCACYVVPLRLFHLNNEELREQWHPFSPPITTKVKIKDSLRQLSTRGYVAFSHRKEGGRDVFLTSKGSIAWESYSKPNWKQFSMQRWRDLPDQSVRLSVMCGSASFLGCIIGTAIPCLDLCPDFGIQQMKFRRVRNWNATYWKVLPIGFYASFRVRKSSDLIDRKGGFTDCLCFSQWGRDDWSSKVPESE